LIRLAVGWVSGVPNMSVLIGYVLAPICAGWARI
jgi:hypothetical protein